MFSFVVFSITSRGGLWNDWEYKPDGKEVRDEMEAELPTLRGPQNSHLIRSGLESLDNAASKMITGHGESHLKDHGT